MTTRAAANRLGYTPALDGIRGLSVAMVVLCHSWIVLDDVKAVPVLGWFVRGGILGVDVFFVLSGFLITSVLLREHRDTNTIGLGQFYIRRAARLLPALYVLLAVESVYSHQIDYRNFLGSPHFLHRTVRNALTYTTNWQIAANPLSPGDLGHLWSLAIEEQFYLVAPLLIALAMRTRISARTLASILIAMLAIVLVARASVYATVGWVEAYHWAWTRVDGLLVGVLVAVLWSSGMLPQRRVGAVASVAVAVIIGVFAVGRGEGGFIYFGGSLLFAAAVGAVIVAVLDGRWQGVSVLEWAPLVATGKISYGIYLWHFPVLGAISRWHGAPDEIRFVVAVAATGVIAVGSWFLIERPSIGLGRRVQVCLARRRRAVRSATSARSLRRYVRTVIAATAAAAIPYCFVLWDGAVDPLRLGVPEGYFGNFFELQARAMASFRWDVPVGSLGIEGFLHEGREYTYFPPFPSFLRVPVLAFTDRFDGRLTALSLLVAWLVTAAFVSLLLWRIRHLVRPDAPLSRAEATLHATVLVTVLSGSTLTYLASVPWVYHEPFAWAVAASLGVTFCLLGVIQRPTVPKVVATALWAVAAILSRTTVGWGCAAAVAGTAVVFVVRRQPRALVAAVAAAAIVPVVVGALVTYLKFETFFMHPLDSQRWTGLSPRRREALAANGGGLIGPQFLPETIWTYLRPDGVRLTSWFPHFSLPSKPPSLSGPFDAEFDQTYRTGSVTAMMPLLVALTLFGLAALVRPPYRAFRTPMLGGVVSTIGVICYGYIAPRYAADFLPLLILGSGIGAVALARRVPARALASTVVPLAVAFAGVGVATNVAVAHHHVRLENGGEALANYVQRQVDSTAADDLAERVVFADEMPVAGDTDQLVVLGDCEALYLGTGERMNEWALVEAQGLRLEVRPRPQLSTTAGIFELARLARVPEMYLQLESDGSGRVRVVIEVPFFRTTSQWLRVRRSDSVVIEVVVNTRHHINAVYVDGEYIGNVPTRNPDETQYFHQAVPRLTADVGGQHDVPFEIEASAMDATPVCDDVRTATGRGLESPGIGDEFADGEPAR